MDTKILIPILFGVIGLVTTSNLYLNFINELNPIFGLIMYYIVLLFVILIVEILGLVFINIEFGYNLIYQTIGLLLIIFSFNLVTSWESCYINQTVSENNSCDGVSNIYLQSEDGAVYYFYSLFIDNININRILTYVVTPVVLSYIGIYLILL